MVPIHSLLFSKRPFSTELNDHLQNSSSLNLVFRGKMNPFARFSFAANRLVGPTLLSSPIRYHSTLLSCFSMSFFKRLKTKSHHCQGLVKRVGTRAFPPCTRTGGDVSLGAAQTSRVGLERA